MKEMEKEEEEEEETQDTIVIEERWISRNETTHTNLFSSINIITNAKLNTFEEIRFNMDNLECREEIKRIKS